jgi:hypothetical protein
MLREWLATFGDGAILVLCYLVFRIYHNHLPHIARKLTDLEAAVAYNKGRADTPAPLSDGHVEID